MTQTTTISIQLNGKSREVEGGMSVRQLLEALDLHPGMIVVELNRDILERESYDEVHVTDGDSLELVQFVGGG